ncbi:lysophospholipid acyltransferase family protein [Cecembia lonarensis]|uniref:Lipid A biosynthesis lauroyl acyltransferase n=1 Tax=Cecembia lonarensis (strain CCUG 58316 / KCTC 22772 / LW9) TaxID=1225176 RepID=K1LIE3_CECL9|nr:lysophospholipid acyltransferase family protein [Cecembia lonarensis]EKB50053.1 lipid A biosynthesis lauroyl acyltransferase [Cecembia lonarensis LW9]
MFIFKLISYLPLPVLYLFTDVLYLFGYHILKYRQKVIISNIQHAFPEKSPQEHRRIAKKFFRNLTDSFAEIIKAYSMSKEEFDKRVKINNYSLVNQHIERAEVLIGMTGHFFNWEWHLLQMMANINNRVDVVYTKVNNPFFEKLMMNIRTRFGGQMVEKGAFQRDYLRKRNQPRMIVLAADQRPGNRDIRYWTGFMNRETAFFEGGEKLAKRFNHPVLYAHVSKPRRGHYVFSYEMMDAPPYTDQAEHSITNRFIALLENNIREHPEIYLWSHNRWKWRKGE